MTRSALFNLVLVVLLGCFAVTGLMWWYVQRVEIQLLELKTQLTAKQEELNNLNQMVEAQAKIDTLTLDERTTTHLELLKHLGIEKMDINFSVTGREARPVGDTSLITRSVQIVMQDSYTAAMSFLDRIFAIGKLHIGAIDLTRGTEAQENDPVQLQFSGTLYSLEKQGEIVMSKAVEVPAVEDAAAVEISTDTVTPDTRESPR